MKKVLLTSVAALAVFAAAAPAFAQEGTTPENDNPVHAGVHTKAGKENAGVSAWKDTDKEFDLTTDAGKKELQEDRVNQEKGETVNDNEATHKANGYGTGVITDEKGNVISKVEGGRKRGEAPKAATQNPAAKEEAKKAEAKAPAKAPAKALPKTSAVK